MRTLKLSHEEISTIESALTTAYLNLITIVDKHRRQVPKSVADEILQSANKYDDLRIAISDGSKDV